MGEIKDQGRVSHITCKEVLLEAEEGRVLKQIILNFASPEASCGGWEGLYCGCQPSQPSQRLGGRLG